MSLANVVMARFPGVEVGIRRIYNKSKNSDVVKNSKLLKKAKSYATDRLTESVKKAEIKSWKAYSDYIRNLGVKNGDILIVHSSMDGLEKMDVEKEEIVSFLQEIVGSDGTLVMPAYPYYKKRDIKMDFNEELEAPRNYNPGRTLSWTGVLPNYMCSLEGARRSLFPIDTLVAVGKDADDIVKNNLNGRISHGKNTAWDYCNSHHAKVLFLGVSPLECISEIHVYEDMNEEEWPIKGWYKEQKFVIKTEDEKIEFICKLRKRFWNQFITENYCMAQLVKVGIMRYEVIEDTPVGFIEDLNKMTDFVEDSVKRRKDLLFWKIPKRYWKR